MKTYLSYMISFFFFQNIIFAQESNEIEASNIDSTLNDVDTTKVSDVNPIEKNIGKSEIEEVILDQESTEIKIDQDSTEVISDQDSLAEIVPDSNITNINYNEPFSKIMFKKGFNKKYLFYAASIPVLWFSYDHFIKEEKTKTIGDPPNWPN